jgi:hypothetical protein
VGGYGIIRAPQQHRHPLQSGTANLIDGGGQQPVQLPVVRSIYNLALHLQDDGEGNRSRGTDCAAPHSPNTGAEVYQQEPLGTFQSQRKYILNDTGVGPTLLSQRL